MMARAFWTAAAMLLGATAATGAPRSAGMLPLVSQGYAPQDADEKGLWANTGELEDQIRHAAYVEHNPQLEAYIRSVLTRLLGEQANDVRIYIVDDPAFNASMTPTGMMIVNTGLLARVHDEAQLAAVLGHEAGHYLRKHYVARWRDKRRKTAVMAFIAAGTNALAGFAAVNGVDSRELIRTASNVNAGLAASIFSFGRDQESEADLYGIKLLQDAGYDIDAAEENWRQLAEERQSSAAMRSAKYRANAASAFSTHPANAERRAALASEALELRRPHSYGPEARAVDRFEAAIGPLRWSLLEEQVKLNDPGASLYLISGLAQKGWTAPLRYYEAETLRLRGGPGDAALALAAYEQSLALPDPPAEGWRACGYARIKAGRRDEGRQALRRYLELRPDAPDKAMINFALNS